MVLVPPVGKRGKRGCAGDPGEVKEGFNHYIWCPAAFRSILVGMGTLLSPPGALCGMFPVLKSPRWSHTVNQYTQEAANEAGCADLLCFRPRGPHLKPPPGVLLVAARWEPWCWTARSTCAAGTTGTPPSTPWSPILQKPTSKSSLRPAASPPAAASDVAPLGDEKKTVVRGVRRWLRCLGLCGVPPRRTSP